MTKRKKGAGQGKSVRFILLALVGLLLLIAILLRGTDVALLQPKGLIAGEQFRLIVYTVSVMLVAAVPTLTLFYFFAWKYRESNDKAAYDPAPRHSKSFVLVLWAIPGVLVLLLAPVMWSATHKLEPHKPIVSDTASLTVQVVALRWKWLFIYPEQHIATVNFVQVPVGTPVQFQLTADEAPMSSFWIPHWGGQLYAMTGHVNRLNLMADTLGEYPGRSAEINGAGFAGMTFTARASSREDFNLWTQSIQQSPNILNAEAYKKLLEPSENHPTAFYSMAETSLYDTVLMKYGDSHHNHTEQQ